MGFDVAVVGYLSLDDIVCPSGHFQDVPGGAAYYAAAGAAAAGARVFLVAQVGHDFPLEALEALEASGVALAGLVRAEGPSRRSLIQDPTGLARALPHHDEPAWWEATQRLAPPLPRHTAPVRLFTAMPAAFLQAQLRAAPAGTTLVADTSPGYARREGPAILATLPLLSCFAPSREETRLLLPGVDDDTALEWLAQRVPLAIQKRGQDGAALRRSGLTLAEPALRAAAVDPTGAGDSLVGAAAAGLAHGLSDWDLLRSGTRVAARTIAGVGASSLLNFMAIAEDRA